MTHQSYFHQLYLLLKILHSKQRLANLLHFTKKILVNNYYLLSKVATFPKMRHKKLNHNLIAMDQEWLTKVNGFMSKNLMSWAHFIMLKALVVVLKVRTLVVLNQILVVVQMDGFLMLEPQIQILLPPKSINI